MCRCVGSNAQGVDHPTFDGDKLSNPTYFNQAGFGWTNGVLLWVAGNYGGLIATPQCPDLLDAPTASGTGGGNSKPASNAQPRNMGTVTLSLVVFVGSVAGHFFF